MEEAELKGLTTAEVQILLDNRNDIEQALKLKKWMDHLFISLVAIELMALLCYILTFIITDDHSWFDWIDFAQIFLAIALIICIVETANVYRNLKYLLVIGIFLFAIDIIISSFLRPLTISQANPLNTRKVDVKRALQALQAMLTVIDFLAIVLALYFRYGSALSYEEVHSRFVDIEISRQKYQKTAILHHLAMEGREIKLKSAKQKAQEIQQNYIEAEERRRMEAQYMGKLVQAPISYAEVTANPTESRKTIVSVPEPVPRPIIAIEPQPQTAAHHPKTKIVRLHTKSTGARAKHDDTGEKTYALKFDDSDALF